jgi:hypothetical protein
MASKSNLKNASFQDQKDLLEFALDLSKQCSRFSEKMDSSFSSSHSIHKPFIGGLLGTIFTEIITPIVNNDEELRILFMDSMNNDKIS